MKTVMVGSGRMGHGLGLCYAIGGHEVVLVDPDGPALVHARASIRDAATLLADAGLGTSHDLDRAIARIEYSGDLAASCAAAELVQEVIQEDLGAKQELMAQVEGAVPDDAILSTNTSSLRIAAIGARMRRPERLIGLHWVAPPYLVPIVEVVRTNATPAELLVRAQAIIRGLGKIPIVVPDVPGFALNRLQYALYAAAVDLVDQGILEPRDVDLMVRHAMAPRLLSFGMLELFDLIVSGRTVQAVSEYLFTETGDRRYGPPGPRQAEMVERGRLGLITGAGWFEYAEPQAEIERKRDETFARAYRALAELERSRTSLSRDSESNPGSGATSS